LPNPDENHGQQKALKTAHKNDEGHARPVRNVEPNRENPSGRVKKGYEAPYEIVVFGADEGNPAELPKGET
jgi:hypothetical protein